MTFQTELTQFRTAWESRVGEQIARLIGGDIEELRNSGILDRTARVGDAFVCPPGLVKQSDGPSMFDCLPQKK